MEIILIKNHILFMKGSYLRKIRNILRKLSKVIIVAIPLAALVENSYLHNSGWMFTIALIIVEIQPFY